MHRSYLVTAKHLCRDLDQSLCSSALQFIEHQRSYPVTACSPNLLHFFAFSCLGFFYLMSWSSSMPSRSLTTTLISFLRCWSFYLHVAKSSPSLHPNELKPCIYWQTILVHLIMLSINPQNHIWPMLGAIFLTISPISVIDDNTT